MNKILGKYLWKDTKSHFKLNIFMLIQFIVIFLVFSILFSYVFKLNKVKNYASDEYENVTKCRIKYENFYKYNLDQYEKLGGFFDSYKYNNLNYGFADSFMFENFQLPLVKGRYPKKQGEALISWANKGKYKLGDKFKFHENNLDLKIEIVGYVKGEYGYDGVSSIMGTFSHQYNGLIIYYNDVFSLYNDGDIINIYLSMDEKAINEFHENYDLGNHRVLTNIQTSGIDLLDELQGTMIAFMAYLLFFAIVLTLIIFLSNIVLNKTNIETERAVCSLCGVPVKAMMVTKIIKNTLYFIVALLISLLITHSSFVSGDFDFDLSYEGWGIAIAVGLAVILISTIINVFNIKKQNISETINTEFKE